METHYNLYKYITSINHVVIHHTCSYVINEDR